MPETPPLGVQLTRALALLKRARIEGNGPDMVRYSARINALLDEMLELRVGDKVVAGSSYN